MNPIPIILIILMFLSLFSAHFFSSQYTRENAEFESAHCPEMLQIDSTYCKPDDTLE